jgi:hypothetical protein
MKKILFLLLMLSVAALGCKRIEHGVVVSKWYEPERHYVWYSYLKTGKYGGISIPHHATDDPDWMIKVSDKEGDEIFEETDELDQGVWEEVEIGDSFFRDTLDRIYFHHNRHEFEHHQE